MTNKVKLGDLITLEYGKGLPASKRIHGSFPVYGSNGVVGFHSESYVNRGIVVGRKGSIGKTELVNSNFWPIDTTYYIEENDKYDLQWVYYLLQTLNLSALNRATGVPGLNRDDVYKISIYCPEIYVQQKIADILSSIDEAIQKTDQIIQKTEELKKGIVAEIVADNVNSQKFKLKDISEVTSSKRVMVSDYVEAGVPFYRSTEIIKKSKNLSVTNPLYISFKKFNSFKNRFGAPERGDLLITAVGTIGDVYLVQNETFYFKDGNTVWIRKLKNFVLPEYLKLILASSFYREKLNDISGGSSQKALTIQKLENVEIPIPSISEQKRTIEILSSVDNKILINQSSRAKLSLLKQGVMQDIFNQKVKIN